MALAQAMLRPEMETSEHWRQEVAAAAAEAMDQG